MHYELGSVVEPSSEPSCILRQLPSLVRRHNEDIHTPFALHVWYGIVLLIWELRCEDETVIN